MKLASSWRARWTWGQRRFEQLPPRLTVLKNGIGMAAGTQSAINIAASRLHSQCIDSLVDQHRNVSRLCHCPPLNAFLNSHDLERLLLACHLFGLPLIPIPDFKIHIGPGDDDVVGDACVFAQALRQSYPPWASASWLYAEAKTARLRRLSLLGTIEPPVRLEASLSHSEEEYATMHFSARQSGQGHP